MANDTCTISKIIWGCAFGNLFWADPETGATTFVGAMDTQTMFDICWAANGKLYGIDWFGGLWLIDPYTAHTTEVMQLGTQLWGINAMVGDNQGNIYVAASSTTQNGTVIARLNTITLQLTTVATISGVQPGGDLTFLNGKLYLTTAGDINNMPEMAVINPGNGSASVYPLINSPNLSPMGMLTMGDGFLYMASYDKIFKIDPETMTVASEPFFDFNDPAMILTGLSNYSEVCNAPTCRPKLKIDTLTAQPFCTTNGVQLKAIGSGINGEYAYEWILPDKTVYKGLDITTKKSGKYYLHYFSTSEVCEKWDSVVLNIVETPDLYMGEDKMICKNYSAELKPDKVTQGITSFYWDDGSAGSNRIVSKAGTYWLRVSNACGAASDTIIVEESDMPRVSLGEDVAICPGSSQVLQNKQARQTSDKYIWSNGLIGETITIQSAGMYWLQNANICGAVRDSIIVSYIDSCTCFPLYPQVALGNDVTICNYETVSLKNAAHQNGFRYNWQDGSHDISMTVKKPGMYWLDIVTQCGTKRDTIVVSEKTEGCERKVMVPSAFTPNGDGNNDLFRPMVFGIAEKYEFIIYNRWGQPVFRSSKPSEGWNGMFNGKKQNADVYVWTCTYQFNGEELRRIKGSVALIK